MIFFLVFFKFDISFFQLFRHIWAYISREWGHFGEEVYFLDVFQQSSIISTHCLHKKSLILKLNFLVEQINTRRRVQPRGKFDFQEHSIQRLRPSKRRRQDHHLGILIIFLLTSSLMIRQKLIRIMN